MPKYEFEVWSKLIKYVEVDADSVDDARDRVSDLIDNGEITFLDSNDIETDWAFTGIVNGGQDEKLR